MLILDDTLLRSVLLQIKISFWMLECTMSPSGKRPMEVNRNMLVLKNEHGVRSGHFPRPV